jgi:hypothetical protein
VEFQRFVAAFKFQAPVGSRSSILRGGQRVIRPRQIVQLPQVLCQLFPSAIFWTTKVVCAEAE